MCKIFKKQTKVAPDSASKCQNSPKFNILVWKVFLLYVSKFGIAGPARGQDIWPQSLAKMVYADIQAKYFSNIEIKYLKFCMVQVIQILEK